MENKIRNVIVAFFRGLKCEVKETENYISVKKIPENIQKNLGLKSEETITFDKSTEGIFADDKSDLFIKIKEYLKTKSGKTLLKIDFDFPSNIQEKIKLRNCSISSVEKKQENNYFSRFTFLTTFRSLNKVEQIINEIFVHEGIVVSGDLRDYKIKEGNVEEASTEHLNKDYLIAKEKLKELLNPKINELSASLNVELKNEKDRIEEHYSKIVNEFNLHRSRALERILEAEKNGEDEEKIKKMKDALEKSFPESELTKVNSEIKEVINNEKSKYSLNIENKLLDTTIIYYPIFKIQICLEESGFKKNIEVSYNPLTESVKEFLCDSCKSNLEEINVCHGGHICCSSCLYSCSECGKRFCKDCFSGLCDSCGKLVCKKCARKCGICKKLFCKNCIRLNSKFGRDVCANCSSYCSNCSAIVEKKSLVKSKSGAMICETCSIKENSKKGFKFRE
jgi:hypothetical protein